MTFGNEYAGSRARIQLPTGRPGYPSGRARDEVPEVGDVVGHVDRGVEHPLGLQAVGGGEEEVGDAIGVEVGVDLAGRLLVADEPPNMPRNWL